MKKLSILIALLLVGCFHEEDSEENEILGWWAYTDDAGCTEDMHFDSDGDFKVKSFNEVLKGTYSIERRESKPQAILHILTDNLGTNCYGNNDSDAEIGYQFYYEIEDNNLHVYNFSDDIDAAIIYTRLTDD